MKNYLKIVSVIGLLLTVLPSFLFFKDVVTIEQHKMMALFGSLVWLTTAPFWLNKKGQDNEFTKDQIL